MTFGRIRRELRIFRWALLDWRICLASKAVLLLGVAYLFVPIDIIPDRIPVLGHLDELGFVLFGFAGSRRLVPADLVALSYADGTIVGLDEWQNLQFFKRVLCADLSNFFLLQYRGVDGFLITGKNSGTHWLKFMLSCAIAEEFGVAPPSRSSGREADRIIGHPRWLRPARLPWIASSHTIPSIAFAWTWFAGLLPHPPVVVLVRDIEAAMRSNYLKWRECYGGSTADYVRGDPTGRRYVADLWWYMHFYNRWGDVSRSQPNNVLVVRYEDLQAAPASCLRRITAHYGIRLGDQAINAALRYVDRDTIRALLDPSDDEMVVPSDDAVDRVAFTRDDVAFMHKMMRRHLRCHFGYAYPLAGVATGAIERTA
jgi:Protein of unknown function (DUF1232)/Sulfotransferase domain